MPITIVDRDGDELTTIASDSRTFRRAIERGDIARTSEPLTYLADALGQVIEAIAADWHHPHNHEGFTTLGVKLAMIDLATPPAIGAEFGFIRPQLHETPRLLGHWTM